jgi:hypothetical protein
MQYEHHQSLSLALLDRSASPDFGGRAWSHVDIAATLRFRLALIEGLELELPSQEWSSLSRVDRIDDSISSSSTVVGETEEGICCMYYCSESRQGRPKKIFAR